MIRDGKLMLVLLWICLFILGGCGPNEGSEDQPQENGQKTAESEISYRTVQEKVFAPRCISCHGNAGGVNLESYQSVITHLKDIDQSTLKTKTMPKDSSLTAAELKLLSDWIDAGAPEGGSQDGPEEDGVDNPPSQETLPEAPPEEERVTFGMVNREIFIPHCIECHGASGGVNLESYNRVKSELPVIKEVVLRFKSMPPPEKGALSAQQLEMLKKWIEQGAP